MVKGVAMPIQQGCVRVNVDSWILLSNNVGSTPDVRERSDKEHSKVGDLLEIADTTKWLSERYQHVNCNDCVARLTPNSFTN